MMTSWKPSIDLQLVPLCTLLTEFNSRSKLKLFDYKKPVDQLFELLSRHCAHFKDILQCLHQPQPSGSTTPLPTREWHSLLSPAWDPSSQTPMVSMEPAVTAGNSQCIPASRGNPQHPLLDL